MGIENRVQKLVDVLNKLPDVETFSSCGGHENPEEYQAPSDKFFVRFTVKKTRKGWRSLELLVWAIHNTDFERLTLEVYNPESTKRGMAFEIYGCESVDPQ
jgi:tRNA(Phe) wybutosine-synthesizing methylase Tyw3